MENFIVSARKYRPATFDTVVGQNHITTTLKNAIKNNQLAQAFLFCGPRGVGKTTCARILAKTINCTNRTPDTEACGECESCKAFENSSSFNIYELDAASNNSVDDIRSLVEQVRYAPQGSKYKVYIIDEVHMLSTSAFNAFLKTLEEPPPYAIFILATTEKHKIIPTILSRCQIFDFNRIKVSDIFDHLKNIAAKENIKADDQGLHIIAQKADGALRDALSIFDQTASFTNRNITYQNVIDNLNILDYDYYFRISDALWSGKTSEALLIYNEIIKKGFDGHNFIGGMSEHIRNLMVSKDPSTLELLEVVEVVIAKYKSQASEFSTLFLLKCLGLLNDCDINYKISKNQRLHVELALLRMCYLNAPKDTEADKKKTPELSPVVESTPDPVQARVTTKSDTTQKPAPAIPVVKMSLKTIRENVTKNEDENQLNEPPPGELKILNTSDVMAAWQSFLANLVDNRKMGMHTVFEKSILDVSPEERKITLSIPFLYYHAEQVPDYKIEITSFLKERIKGQFMLGFLCMEKDGSEDKKPKYTSREKFEHMLEKNPDLQLLADKLGLDFIF